MSIEIYLYDIGDYFSDLSDSIRKAREEREERRHLEIVSNYKNDIKLQKDIIKSSIDEEKESLDDIFKNINKIVDGINKNKNIICSNNTIKNKLGQIVNEANELKEKYVEKISKRINELKLIDKQITDIYNKSINEDNEYSLDALKSDIKGYSVKSKINDLNEVLLSLNTLNSALNVLMQINQVLSSMKEENSKFVNEYVAKITSLLERTDILNSEDVSKFIATFNEVNKEFKAELLVEKSKANVLEKQEQLQMFFDIIDEIDVLICSVSIQDYLELFNDLRKRVVKLLDKLTNIESVSIANRKVAIEKKIAKYSNPNNFTRDDYNTYINLIEELELLVLENNDFNAKKELFNTYYDKYKKAAIEAGEEVNDLSFDLESFDETIVNLADAIDELYDIAFQKKYIVACHEVSQEFIQDGFIELKAESQKDELSTRKVFFKKDNPFIAVLVDVTPSARIIVRTVPLAIKYRNKFVCLESNEDLLEKITGNCNAIHRDKSNHIVDQNELDKINYFVLSPDGAIEYCKELNIDLSTIVANENISNTVGVDSKLVLENELISTANSKDNEMFIDE